MAVATRGTRKTPTKSSNRSKASGPKAIIRSKTTRTVVPLRSPAIEVPETPSQDTITPDEIEEMIEAPTNEDLLRQILAKELNKKDARVKRPRTEVFSNDESISKIVQRILAKASRSRSDSDSDSSRVHKKRRRHQRKHYYSDNTDSEDDKRRKVSFLEVQGKKAEISTYLPAELGRDPPQFWYNQTSMSRETARFLWWGLSSNTRKTYATRTKSYTFFCAMRGIKPPFPATNSSLMEWVAHLGNKRVKATTIKAYLTDLRSAHIDIGFEEDLDAFHSLSLQRVIAGIRRLRGEAGTQERRPITKDLLLHWR